MADDLSLRARLRLELEKMGPCPGMATPKMTGLTLREAVAGPLPLLEERLTQRASPSLARPHLPRTFGDILPWPEFLDRSRELYNSLDDTKCTYNRPGYGSIEPGPVTFESAADEVDVRGRIVTILRHVHSIARILGIPAQCNGGGGGRSMSFTDLVMRPAAAVTELADVSRKIIGVVEVKGDWHFKLERGERLEDAMHDPERSADVLRVIQQVYGDAVLDEAPFLILSNYQVTVFLRRSEDVRDTRLWASEPIWFDHEDPPVRVCWVHALQQAEELRDLKQSLPRAMVPADIKVDHFQPQVQQAVAEQDTIAEEKAAGAGSSANRKRQRIAEQQADQPGSSTDPLQQPTTRMSSRLQARNLSGKGRKVDDHNSPAPHPASASLTDPEETIPLAKLGLTGELLWHGQYGYTFKGNCDGQPVAVKVYNTEKRDASETYEHEKLAYKALTALQGETIPRLMYSGLMQHTASPLFVTKYEGDALKEDTPVPRRMHKPMRKALQALHAAGAAHGEVRHSNFVVSDGKVRLVDLGQAVLRASRSQMDADMRNLKEMSSS